MGSVKILRLKLGQLKNCFADNASKNQVKDNLIVQIRSKCVEEVDKNNEIFVRMISINNMRLIGLMHLFEG